MADARSMLRASREARKIKHPHASYTKDGKLLCNLCETLVKTESAWQSHLHSTQHTLRLSRARDAAAARASGDRNENGASKKRKASTIESPLAEDRKKSKPVSFTPGLEEPDNEESAAPIDNAKDAAKNTEQLAHETKADPLQDDQDADAEELEAWDRELAEMERSMGGSTTIYGAAVISAAPMTAEEIAAQAREQQSRQRGKRDAELEAEKEDAARLLEDEFEEMEELELRAKRLREKREALREAATMKTAAYAVDNTVQAVVPSTSSASDADSAAHNAEDDDEDEDEDDDVWNFGSR